MRQSYGYGPDDATFAQPALTKICRTVREEALPIFYSKNQFAVSAYSYDHAEPQSHVLQAASIVMGIGNGNELFPWLQSIGALNVARVKELFIHLPYMTARSEAVWDECRKMLLGQSEHLQVALPPKITLLRPGEDNTGMPSAQGVVESVTLNF